MLSDIDIEIIDQIDSQSFVVYFTDGSFVTVTVDELLYAFPDRFRMEELGHKQKFN